MNKNQKQNTINNSLIDILLPKRKRKNYSKKQITKQNN